METAAEDKDVPASPDGAVHIDTADPAADPEIPEPPPANPNNLPRFMIPGASTEELFTDHQDDLHDDGDFGDSDEEGDEAKGHETAADEAMAERMISVVTQDDDRQVIDDICNSEIIPRFVHDQDLAVKKQPDDWKAPARKTKQGEPAFDSLDNPGGWNDFVYLRIF